MRPGDRVALFIHNIPLFVEAYYGILRAGAAVVPLNVLYKSGEVEYILNDSGAKAILTFAPFAQVALAAAANAPELRARRRRRRRKRSPARGPGASVFASGARDRAHGRRRRAKIWRVITYTSGTTGRPKGAMLTHRNLLANCEQCSQIERIQPRADDIVWIALPLFHIYGMNVAMNLSFMHGATILLIDRFEPASGLDAVQPESLHGGLWRAADVRRLGADAQHSRIRPLQRALHRLGRRGAARAHYGVVSRDWRACLSAKATASRRPRPVVTSNAAGPVTRPGTVGPAIPGVEVKIVDEQRQRAAARRDGRTDLPRAKYHEGLLAAAAGDRRGTAQRLAAHRRPGHPRRTTATSPSWTARKT